MIKKEVGKLSNAMLAGLYCLGIGVLVLFGGLWILLLFRTPLASALVGLGTLGIVAGLLLLGYGIVTGLRVERKAASSSTAVQIPNSRIVARFAINSIGETLFSEMDIDFDDPRTKLFIRIEPTQGPQIELTTNEAVWSQCGEGMTGTAVVQGDWLGSFVVTRGVGEGDPYRG